MESDITPEVTAFAEALRAHLDPATVRVALDVGSRDGHVAILLQGSFPNARVFAFECNPDCIAKCRSNLMAHPTITLVEKAVLDKSGVVDFFAIDPARTVTPHADGNIGASSIHLARPDYPYEKYAQVRIQVPCTSLEKWAQENRIPAIDVLWMDLQGAELKALQGLGTLIQTVNAIHTEVQYRPIYFSQPLAPDIHRFLTAHGFSLAKTLYQDAWMGNLLYVPSRPTYPGSTG